MYCNPYTGVEAFGEPLIQIINDSLPDIECKFLIDCYDCKRAFVGYCTLPTKCSVAEYQARYVTTKLTACHFHLTVTPLN